MMETMNVRHSIPISLLAKAALGMAALAAATGFAFASWLDQGDGIFMAMVDAGLSWCF